ncbi:MAG: type II secretion system protein [Desulfatibacillaceae bacterium]
MKREGRRTGRQSGFTLLEVILAIIMASILGAVFVQYMGSSLAQSGRPLMRLGDRLTLEQIVENMTADYKGLMATSPTPPLATFKSRVESGTYGTYTLDHCGYVGFTSSGAETSGGDTVLKVTVSRGDQKITALFTR